MQTVISHARLAIHSLDTNQLIATRADGTSRKVREEASRLLIRYVESGHGANWKPRRA
jgi:hypothetical protein